MPDLPTRFATLIITFAPLFVQRSWLHARVLLVGAILAPGRRTVASVLRITGHARDRHFTIARTTPCLLALFSTVTLLAGRLPKRQRHSVTTAAWYPKARPTFSDALAAVRRAIWREQYFQTSPRQIDRRKVPFRMPQAWAYALCNMA